MLGRLQRPGGRERLPAVLGGGGGRQRELGKVPPSPAAGAEGALNVPVAPREKRNHQLPRGPSLAFLMPSSCFPISQSKEGSGGSLHLETQN